MAGIAGVAEGGAACVVIKIIDKIRHRGGQAGRLMERPNATFGQIGLEQPARAASNPNGFAVLDGLVRSRNGKNGGVNLDSQDLWNLYDDRGPDFVSELSGPFAVAIAENDGIYLARDPVGVAPLYYGFADDTVCFASEAKGIVDLVENVQELPPGHYFLPPSGLVQYAGIEKKQPMETPPENAAQGLADRLTEAISKSIASAESMGCWVSGGLDSSAITALASQQMGSLHTFSAGVAGASDLEYARIVARHLGSKHHERLTTVEEMAHILPEVIYHLESFDALLVRSSIMNYLVGKMASEYVEAALSGEGGDELFAGYDYLKALPASDLPDELIDITNRLHNTALQRVDRCSRAHGLVAYTPFLDMDVVDYALRIPAEYKIRRGPETIEKWILRMSVDGLLPDSVLKRPKAKFWEGAGVKDLLEEHVNSIISDTEFAGERELPDGEYLNTKEELFYYRIFREHFGELADLSFVGRTKGAPVS